MLPTAAPPLAALPATDAGPPSCAGAVPAGGTEPAGTGASRTEAGTAPAQLGASLTEPAARGPPAERGASATQGLPEADAVWAAAEAGPLGAAAEAGLVAEAEAEAEAAELVFGVVLSCPGPGGVVLGRRSACRVTIVGERAGLPERVRLDWSRLRFPDAAWRLRRLGPKDRR